MAYKVEYGLKPQTRFLNKKSRREIKHSKFTIAALIVIMAICLLVEGILSDGYSTVNSAMNDMINNIIKGEQAVNAFAEFCKTVLQIR